ncbi:MFS transporter [Brevibacillus borstelensis]|uniref:MFS transporter n=1 Tax=Brevibacillus borstelensis TaxID=45462 RepID=UPI003CC91DAC
MEKERNEQICLQTEGVEAAGPARTFGRLKAALAWLGFLGFFSVLNETVFTVSLPDIAKQFGVPPSTANWVTISFVITFGIGSAIYGRLSDMYGVKWLLVIGLCIYSGGSLLGLFAQASFPAVLAARFIQGAGASAVPAMIMVMIARYVGAGDRGKAFGVVGSLIAMGEGIGPVIGGVIADSIHWSFLFLIPVVTLVSIPFFLRALPDEPARKGKVDVPGALLLSAVIVMFTLYTTGYQWGYLAGSILLLGVFALYIHRANEPFIEPALFGKPRFVKGVLSGCMLLGTVAGFISMVPYMMREMHHLSTGLIGGGILFPGTMSVALFGAIGGRLADRRGHAFVMTLGVSMITASFLVTALFAEQTPWLTTGALVLTFGGLSFVKTVISSSVADTLEEHEAGAGMGMLNLACFLSEGIGIAIVGGMLSNRFLDFPLLPTVSQPGAFAYSNLLLVFVLVMFAGRAVYALAFDHRRR